MTGFAHRAALDHVLTLIAESEWAHVLVLRGSMTMPAWVGDAARPPADLDWIAWHPPWEPRNDLNPYPYVDRVAAVQLWPEVAHGAARNEIWEFENFDTGGWKPRLPPEDLHWATAAEAPEPWDYVDELLPLLIAARPRTDDGLAFHTEQIESEHDWDYAEYEPGAEGGRIRLRIPWKAADGENGAVQLDLTIGERLPEPPVCTAVPRAGGQPPVGLWTASRELSLAWKLHWLAADQETHGVSAMKDLYDAVLLAELDGMHLRPMLQRVALRTEPSTARSSLELAQSPVYTTEVPSFSAQAPYPPGVADSRSLAELLTPDAIRRWPIEGDAPGGGGHVPWLERLAAATDRLL
ncbi:nucleotidyl transferase AbiEii/AbiGii toxin family protein [Actinoplanes utahensis]|uniref:nucleotidyl transferase AbiEii/AbiGii toxin family protein n=1 Tax=Actinoplanes utahensis TaxID=1869 RepID=UPI0009FC47E6|nr:nucleotidyl transferase AbiEii/AbiGii toxin family protein [Actinoplanes utahensis]GIF27778.1 hypothetical protein Aut01nite_07640 [Actinoplanes utahensis]